MSSLGEREFDVEFPVNHDVGNIGNKSNELGPG